MARVDEWVEAAGSTVDLAVAAALQELGLSSRDEAEIEVIQEPSKGILGTAWRAQDAIVKVSPKPKEGKKRRRRKRKRGSGGEGESKQSAGAEPKSRQGGKASAPAGSGKKTTPAGRAGGKSSGSPSRQPATPQKATPASGDRKTSAPNDRETERRRPPERSAETQEATIEEQADVAAGFLRGLLEALGLEGAVNTEIDEDILKITVTGDQTEALVGRKGVIMQAVHEITRTVIQRKTFGAPRMRLDINGYGERRREALKIYSVRQAERVLADGGEIMLEPMNPADRKVVHDAIGEIDGVESFSEGVEPDRAVVIARVEGAGSE